MSENNSVLGKSICLKVNSVWQPIGIVTPETAFTNLSNDTWRAFNIERMDADLEPTLIQAVDLATWITLPIRHWDNMIHTPKLRIRVPTVVICTEFTKMPSITPAMNLQTVYNMYNGIDQYSGKPISKRQASVDHIVPKNRGGKHEWGNITLADRDLNSKKGNKLNEEIGLKLLSKPKVPKTTPVCFTLKNIHSIKDWEVFLRNHHE